MLFFILQIFLFIDFCHSKHQNVNELSNFNLHSFASKTAYRNCNLKELDMDRNDLSTCKLVHVNAIFRHGTRSPSRKSMKKMLKLHKKILSSDSQKNLPKSFLDWEMPFSLENDKGLALAGYEEMKELGERFRTKISSIDRVWDHDDYVKVYSSSLSRSKSSAITFLRNLLKNNVSEDEGSKMVIEDDERMRFFSKCPHYIKTVRKNHAAKEEYHKFLKGPEVASVVREVQDTWNLTDIDLTPGDVQTLFLMCAFETATNLKARNLLAPACSLLEGRHLAVLEYLGDLKHYWLKAYPRRINWLQACALGAPLAEQLLKAARSHQDGDQAYPRAAFWFGHAETVLPLVTLLGLFNESAPLTAAAFPQRLAALADPARRFSTFRAGLITPFAGNIALDLVHCPGPAEARAGSCSSGRDRDEPAGGHRVQLRINERMAPWGLGGPSSSHLPLETLLQRLAGLCLPHNYDHKTLCRP